MTSRIRSSSLKGGTWAKMASGFVPYSIFPDSGLCGLKQAWRRTDHGCSRNLEKGTGIANEEIWQKVISETEEEGSNRKTSQAGSNSARPQSQFLICGVATVVPGANSKTNACPTAGRESERECPPPR